MKSRYIFSLNIPSIYLLRNKSKKKKRFQWEVRFFVDLVSGPRESYGWSEFINLAEIGPFTCKVEIWMKYIKLSLCYLLYFKTKELQLGMLILSWNWR